ncbi:MAG: hypothetical protein HY762_04650 [Planctomycetes bacterium]|nr:hypothetical protein [Planctomycetota bacterium]
MLIWGGWDGQTPLDSGAIYFPISNTWKAITTTGGTGAPSRRTEHTAVWTGPGTETWRNKMLVWGGTWPGIEYYNDGKIYDPLTDTWSDMKNATVSESWIEGYDQFGNPVWSFYGPMSVSNRAYHTAIWSSTTNEMLIWGGWNGVSFLNTGAKYSPGGDSWDAIADPLAASLGGCSGSIPSARSGHTVVWSGGGMVMWGGQQFASYLGDYWTYNPLGTWPNPNNDSATGWESVTYTGTAPIARTEHTIVLWSDGPETKLIIWGGRNGINSTNYLNSGGLYNMFYAQWFAVSEDNAPSGRVGHTATWTGTKMVVWGGTNGTIYFNDGGKYNPTTASWAPVLPPQPIPIEPRMRHTAVWTGSVAENATGEMIVFGGQDFNQEYNNGGKYNPNGDIWSAISLRDAPISRTQHTAIWTGTVSNQMVIWGGYYRVGNLYLNSGGVYSPTSNTWVKMSELNAPSGRSNHTACWAPDRKEMLVWGGWDGSGWLDTGRQYYPITDTWNTTVITTTSAPAARTNHTAVWTGTQMIIWGGLNANNMPLDTGGRYTPSTDSWADTAIGGDVPISRAWHTAICRSDWPYDMIIWGGATNTDPNQAISSSNYKTLNSGALYSPLSNTWLALPTINAPASRTNHTAVWTQNWGTPVMIVWGGWDGNNYLNTGGKYNPANLTWSLIDSPPDFSSPPDFTGPPDGVPDFLGRVYHSSFWTGTEMIIFGGAVFGGPPPFGIPIGYTNTSAKYRP